MKCYRCINSSIVFLVHQFNEYCECMKVCEEPLFKGFWLPTLLYHVNIVHTLPCTQCTLATMFTNTILYLVFVPTLPCGNCTMYIHYPVYASPLYHVYLHYQCTQCTHSLPCVHCRYTTFNSVSQCTCTLPCVHTLPCTLYIQYTTLYSVYPLYHMSLYINY